MKIAIVGAGIAGLSCAYEFRKHGIIPTIFEQKRKIGEDIDFCTTTFRIYDRIYGDPVKYLKSKCGLTLKPINNLKTIEMYGPKSKVNIRGNFGYLFLRGYHETSLENQMAYHADVPITFDRKVYIKDIKNDFDYIIDATGSLELAKELGLFTPYLNAFTRIAVVEGKFDVHTAKIWFNTEYSKHAFCHLLPHSSDKANFGLTVDNISQNELDYYWGKFIKIEKITERIIKTGDVLHTTGSVKPHKKDNIYFIGKAGGFLESVLGVGMIDAIETGALAARSIVKKLDYEELVKPMYNSLLRKYEQRKFLNTFDNKTFDRMIKFMGLPVIKQAIYNNSLTKANYVFPFLKVLNKLNGR